MKEETKRKALDLIKSNTNISKNSYKEDNQNISSDLAYSLFGKVYGGNPESGVVPGASPMSEDDIREFAFKAARGILASNGYDPKIADELSLKWFGKVY